jgi:hypothetical protein
LNQPVKLLLDECLGPPLAKDLAQMLSWDTPPPEIKHLFQYFKSGTKDSEWIPEIAREQWIILTTDKGKKKDNAKLPLICAAYKVTHIVMGPSLLHAKQIQKAGAIIALWEKIKECHEAPKGTKFRMMLDSKGRPKLERVS